MTEPTPHEIGCRCLRCTLDFAFNAYPHSLPPRKWWQRLLRLP